MTPLAHIVVCQSPTATQLAGAILAPTLHPGSCLTLEGELGAGKTTFTRGLAAGLGIPGTEVSSPSFSLVHWYAAPSGILLLHADGFRLGEVPGSAEGLELEEADDAITVVEWPAALADELPAERLEIELRMHRAAHVGRGEAVRELHVRATSEQTRELLDRWLGALAGLSEIEVLAADAERFGAAEEELESADGQERE